MTNRFAEYSFQYNIFPVLLAFFLLSCIQNPQIRDSGSVTPGDTATASKQMQNLHIDTLDDAMASVISGMDTVRICRDLTKEKAWAAYRQHIRDDWRIVVKNKVDPIMRWRNKHFPEGIPDTAALFYPFAGADFLYANAFFPHSKSYIMIGLEPIGKLHRCDTMKMKDFLAYLEKIRSALYYSNQLGFFRTESMEKDLKQQTLDGTLPLLVFYIRKTGHRLTGITYFNLDQEGKIVPCRQDTSTTGVRIDFCDSTMKKPQSLYYLSFDLSDKNLTKHGELLQFVKSSGKQFCFIKAASYLMFTSGFGVMRNYILDQETAILQDDSGIPYRFFKHSNWNVSLYGTYTQTIDLFKYKFQPDLQAAYEKQETTHPVPFRIGYNVKFNETNLLFATRKN